MVYYAALLNLLSGVNMTSRRVVARIDKRLNEPDIVMKLNLVEMSHY